MDLKQIKELLSGVENACLELEIQSQSELAQIATQKTKLAEKSKQLDEREAKIELKEKEFVKKSADVEAKYSKIRSDEQLRVDAQAVEQQRALTIEDLKKAQEERGEARIMLADITKRELALASEKESYKTKIKQQVAEGLIGKINA
jgi:hypothetical protein